MKLTYFKAYGRAEAIRMLLHHSKTDFEDKHVSFEDLPAMKASGELPNGQLPIFEMDGRILNQSAPILRLLGDLKGYYNKKDASEAYEADWVIATVDDTFVGDFYRTFMGGEAADEATVADKVARQHKLFAQIDARLGEKKYFGGESMSIADFYAFGFVQSFPMNKTSPNPVQAHVYAALNAEFPKYANLARWNDTMIGEGGFAEYLEKRVPAVL